MEKNAKNTKKNSIGSTSKKNPNDLSAKMKKTLDEIEREGIWKIGIIDKRHIVLTTCYQSNQMETVNSRGELFNLEIDEVFYAEPPKISESVHEIWPVDEDEKIYYSAYDQYGVIGLLFRDGKIYKGIQKTWAVHNDGSKNIIESLMSPKDADEWLELSLEDFTESQFIVPCLSNIQAGYHGYGSKTNISLLMELNFYQNLIHGDDEYNVFFSGAEDSLKHDNNVRTLCNYPMSAVLEQDAVRTFGFIQEKLRESELETMIMAQLEVGRLVSMAILEGSERVKKAVESIPPPQCIGGDTNVEVTKILREVVYE